MDKFFNKNEQQLKANAQPRTVKLNGQFEVSVLTNTANNTPQ